MNGWSISSFTLAILSHWIDGEPAGLTKVRRQASEDVARMFARTASACQRCSCGCALPLCRASHLLHFLNQTPMGSKRKKKKNAIQHINGLQLLNTTWFTPSGHKKSQFFLKNQPYVWHTQERPNASKPCVCCTRKDRKRAGMRGSGTSRATQHGWSSLAASGAANWVAKKLQALSNSSVAVLVERRSSHHLPEAHHVDPNASTANQVSALLHDFTYFQGTRLRALGSGRSATIP